MTFLNNAELRMPKVLLFGQNSVNALTDEVKKLNKKKALLVTDDIMIKEIKH